MLNRRMPNGTYWWCERAEKVRPTRLEEGYSEKQTAESLSTFFQESLDFGNEMIYHSHVV